MAIRPAIIGHKIQVLSIVIKTFMFVEEPVYKFQPTIAPTMAWVVETGKPNLVIMYTDSPAATHAAKAPGSAFIAPSFPKFL